MNAAFSSSIAWMLAAGMAAVPAAVSAADPPIRAGQWEVRSAVLDIDMPGAPPGMAAMIKGKPTVVRHCLTPEQAAQGPQEMLKDSRGQCRFSRYDMTGGRIDAVMECSGQGGQMTSTTTGTYSAEGYQAESRMTTTGPAGKMTMRVSGSGKYLGPCGAGSR